MLADTTVTQNHADLWAPAIQYGFAGFSVLLLALLFWLIKRVLDVLSATGVIIEKNTATISNLAHQLETQSETLADVRDKLLARRCMMDPPR